MNTLISEDKDIDHLHDVLRHIQNVRDNCDLLGGRLIEGGEKELGIQLISLGLIHDYSKLHNKLEFDSLRESLKGTPEFEAAVISHINTNNHHPESWAGIDNMPRIYIAEMVCDWKARSSEFANDLRSWIKEKATKKFKFSCNGSTYKEIRFFVETLLDESFKD